MIVTKHDWLLIAAGTALLTIAYPPFGLVVPAFVCLAPAVLLILHGAGDEHPIHRHLHQGFWYGTVANGALLYWLAGALWQYGRITVVLWGITAVMFGGATAVMFAVVGRIARGHPSRVLLAFPAGVIFLEWLAAQVGPISFPWHQLGLTVAAAPVLVQAADIAGADGLGFVVAFINAAVALAWWSRPRRPEVLRYLEVAATSVVLLTVYGLHRINTVRLDPGVTVVVVQPNVQVDAKWSAVHQDAIVARTIELSERATAAAQPALVVWPETALPGPVRLRDWSAWVRQSVWRTNTTILTGGVEDGGWDGAAPVRYNAALVFEPRSTVEPPIVHRKQKLIPMIEWAPRDGSLDLSRTGFGGFTPGYGAPLVAASAAGPYGVLLCYEITFSGMARSLRRQGAGTLITMSNDAWFGRTAAAQQHFAHAVLRAVENRVTVVRAANTGISGIVDPLGRVTTRTEPFVTTYAFGRISHVAARPPSLLLAGSIGPLTLLLLVSLLASVLRPGRSRLA